MLNALSIDIRLQDVGIDAGSAVRNRRQRELTKWTRRKIVYSFRLEFDIGLGGRSEEQNRCKARSPRRMEEVHGGEVVRHRVRRDNGCEGF
jgi:hypothetical protein